jgi:hypothetical protein
MSGMRNRIPAFLIVMATPIALFAATDPAHPLKPKFVDAVESERYPSASSRDEPELRWDFSQKRDYRFRFDQTSDGTSSFGEPGESKNSMSVSGDLIVRTKGDGTAKLVFENAKMTMKIRVGDQDHADTQDLPTTVIGGMNEDGSSAAVANQQAFLKLLFPLPPKALPVGASVDLPVEIPFSAMGSVLPAKGRNRIKNAGYVMLGKRLCVQLDTDMQVSELDVPEEVAGKYDFAASGRSVFFFDVETHSFVRGVIALVMRLGIDAPAPAFAASSGEKKSPERLKMGMTSDDLIKVAAAE